VCTLKLLEHAVRGRENGRNPGTGTAERTGPRKKARPTGRQLRKTARKTAQRPVEPREGNICARIKGGKRKSGIENERKQPCHRPGIEKRKIWRCGQSTAFSHEPATAAGPSHKNNWVVRSAKGFSSTELRKTERNREPHKVGQAM